MLMNEQLLFLKCVWNRAKSFVPVNQCIFNFAHASGVITSLSLVRYDDVLQLEDINGNIHDIESLHCKTCEELLIALEATSCCSTLLTMKVT